MSEDKKKQVTSDALSEGGKANPGQGEFTSGIVEENKRPLPDVIDAETTLLLQREKAYEGEGLWEKDKEEKKDADNDNA